MKRNRSSLPVTLALASVGMLAAGAVHALPITMTGNFLLTQISDDGTLGDGSSSPGLVHDPSGTGTFDTSFGDYLRPGIPFEGFGVASDQFSTIGNRNSVGGGTTSGDGIAQFGALLDLSAGTANHVRWMGTAASLFNIQHDFFFNDGDENISITTVITALTDLTNVTFSRAIDPDPDNYSGGTASTNNERGLDLNSDGDYDDPGELSPADFVSASGSLSGLTMAMFTDSLYTHNSGIVGSCCDVINPASYLSGGSFGPALGFDSVGDHGIGLGFQLGNLATGQSATITYAYVFGDTVETVDIPTTGVPEPATLALLGAGFAGFAWRRRRGSRV